MKIDSAFPSPKDFINNEIETLKYISAEKNFYELFPTLASTANSEYRKLVSRKNALVFDFESEIEIGFMDHASKIGKAHLGAMIKIKDAKSYENVTYHLSICEDKPPKSR